MSHGKWKYIKRKWVKGKWRYWYKDDEKKQKTTMSTHKTTPQKTNLNNSSLKNKTSKSNYFTLDKESGTTVPYDPNKKKETTKKKESLFDKAKNFLKKVVEKTVEEVDEFVDKGKEFINNLTSDPLPLTKKKDKPYTQQEDQAAVNPKYNEDIPTYSYNCGKCSLAYDLRRRGYDVEARGEWDGIGLTVEDINKCYDTEWTIFNPGKLEQEYEDRVSDEVKTKGKDKQQAMEQLSRELAANGDGSRGILAVWWSLGGGHGINWEVENGVTYIVDSQINKRYRMDEYDLTPYIKSYQYIRTDNLEPDMDVMKYVRNR